MSYCGRHHTTLEFVEQRAKTCIGIVPQEEKTELVYGEGATVLRAVSPKIEAERVENGVELTVTDIDGIHEPVLVKDGELKLTDEDIEQIVDLIAEDENFTVPKATKLSEERTISIDGEALGSAKFDGSQDITIHTAVLALSNMDLEEMLQ